MKKKAIEIIHFNNPSLAIYGKAEGIRSNTLIESITASENAKEKVINLSIFFILKYIGIQPKTVESPDISERINAINITN